MTPQLRNWLTRWLWQLPALLLAWMPFAHAEDAEVVMLLGQADYQLTPQEPWKPVTLKQLLTAGTALRTRLSSQVALLLRDQTQIRLNEQSQILVTGVATAQDGTTIELARGRMWAQARQYVIGPLRSVSSTLARAVRLGRPPLMVVTPTSTIGIRGTDWELVVEDDRTVLTVLSGEVEISNAFGQALVGPNEQAVAVRGQAPTKTLLVQARDRVQWVTAYRPSPRRWAPELLASVMPAVAAIEAGDYALALPLLQQQSSSVPAARLLLADMLMFMGRAAEAAALLDPLTRAGTSNPRAVALQARALVLAGQPADASSVLARMEGESANDVEVLLARADLALLDGAAPEALALFARVTTQDPQRSEAWFGIGRIHNEREDVRRARAALDEALRLAADAPGYRGERATVDTLAGALTAARAGFAEALQREPTDYVAWTGQGIVQLKAGEIDAALQSFLRAGVLEPGFARAQLYTGVAYYQLGHHQRALEAVQRAADLDPRDPLPYVLLARIRADAQQLGASIDAAREAQARMPYLKSLNQLLNDQKGSANLGSALAAFGLEEWATYYAYEAYSPYWAGSHLFLADRHTGDFDKNSELFKGFITDPTVFGASNRFSSLIAVPGHYGRLDLFLERNNWYTGALIGTVNGLFAEPFPMAYYLSGDLSDGASRDNKTTGHGRNLTLGLGARPRHDIGLFAFGTNTDIDTTIRSADFPQAPLAQREDRGDIGINFKLAPDNQFWFKAGAGRQQNDVSGTLVSQTSADALNLVAAPFVFGPAGSLDRFNSSVVQHDQQFRHAFSSGSWQWTWGVEHSRQVRSGAVATSFDGLFGGLTAHTTVATTDRFTVNATDTYLGTRYRAASGVEFEGALFAQHARTTRSGSTTVEALIIGAPPPILLLDAPNAAAQRFAEINPRLGVRFALAERQALRLVAQHWRRPGSAGTLAPVDTLGIALNDRLPIAGGLYQRTRLQYDAELGSSRFVQAFVDAERVDNGLGGARNTISVFELTQLQNLRNREDVFSPRPDLEDTPIFGRGTVRTAGLVANQRWGKDQTLSLRYLYRDSQQGGAGAGLSIPYIPRHFLRLASQWSLRDRWLLGVSGTYRSLRFRDDTNLDPIHAGWAFGVSASWESEDKRTTVQAILDNLLSRSSAGDRPDAHLLLRLAYRF